MSSTTLAALVSQVVEAAQGGKLLSEALYHEILNEAPPCWDESDPETLALAIRRLDAYCDWSDFRWVQRRLNGGASLDEIYPEVKFLRQKREAAMRCPPSDPDIQQDDLEEIGREADRIFENQCQFLTVMRNVEILMGFDQDVTDDLLATLGRWDTSAVPGRLLDLLPEEVRFPLFEVELWGPYDHLLHCLGWELVQRLGKDGRSSDAVIKHCGHVLADLLPSDDAEESSALGLYQASLLADDYIRRNPREIIALCWRGELACLTGDTELAAGFAERVWEEAANLTAKDVHRVTAFFALATGPPADWGLRNWHCPDFVRYHLGEIKATWIVDEQPLALAIVRRAFRQGNWDTSLLCSTHALRMSLHYCPKPDDLPADCWVWLAEHNEYPVVKASLYYEYWCYAYEALADDTKPDLVHNILVVLLAGMLFDQTRPDTPPSIQRLLNDLNDLHRDGTMPDKKEAALEIAKHVYREMNPDYLTAADRLAITKATEESVRQSRSVPITETPPAEPSDSSRKQINVSHLNQAEIYLKRQISEATWARLSSKAKDEFKHGEFLYIMASTVKGEGGNFDSFVLHYSKGLLVEIQESLRGPLIKNPSLKGEFLKVFGQTDHPEWSELLGFLNNLEKVAGTPLGKHLLSQRIALQRLPELREHFEKMMSCRNKAAHTKHRIDREEATVLHALLLNKGFVQKVVQFFPKALRR